MVRPNSYKIVGNCLTCSKVVPPRVDIAMETVGGISNCLDTRQSLVTMDWCEAVRQKSCLHSNIKILGAAKTKQTIAAVNILPRHFVPNAVKDGNL